VTITHGPSDGERVPSGLRPGSPLVPSFLAASVLAGPVALSVVVSGQSKAASLGGGCST
jgi:hypothetical protein